MANCSPTERRFCRMMKSFEMRTNKTTPPNTEAGRAAVMKMAERGALLYLMRPESPSLSIFQHLDPTGGKEWTTKSESCFSLRIPPT